MEFLIAYDIAAPARLRRVAAFLQRRAIRCQKSVFHAEATSQELASWLDEIGSLINPREDVVQAWPLKKCPSPSRMSRGKVLPLHQSAAVCFATEPIVVASPDRRRRSEERPTARTPDEAVTRP